ncbi:uncharacterized protein LOC121989320 isoform X1 [Zingiber officinale]|uniref:uncharacterized protein LOC121989320 isoform X1 n=1 Tax=Zingiber officinale TaxID=94328 RepID=UPI001C4D5311|nr:uncharacterized protein LOC121989320 isoform X1 [Zingiber officinale]
MAPAAQLPFLFLFALCQLPLRAQAAAKAVPVVGNISKVDDSELFHIYYGQSFKVIKNSVDGKSYLLMQSNSRMAARTKYCTGRIKSFVVPLSNYSVDTTKFPVSFFELLGLLESFKGMTSDQITSQCLLKSYISGGIQLVRKTDMQQLTQFSAHFISNVDQQQACNFAAFVPLDERTPLQRAEWIKYLATFTNSEVRANSVYDAVKENYMCLKKAAANLTSKFKPIVAWVVYNQGVWSFSKESFESEFVRDAGGENIDDTISENSYNVSDPDDMDNFHAILCTVDVVIDQTYVAQPEVYKLSTFLENMDVEDDSRFAFLTNQRVWRYDKRVYNSAVLDWFDGAISQPQLVLADLIEAFFPTGNYNTTYFRNIAKDEGVITMDPELCDRNPSTPMDPVIVPCQ